MMKLTFSIFILFLFCLNINAQNLDITGTVGSETFGETVTILSNGNYVVTDSKFDNGNIKDVGAVYLYNGKNHTLISTLIGKTANDQAGYKITVLSNGNYLVSSYWKSNGYTPTASAITWCNKDTGMTGTIDSMNSLLGGHRNFIGDEIVILKNGNYVLSSPRFNFNTGAVTWGNGNNPLNGYVDSNNSILGKSKFDYVGKVHALPNGNYIIISSNFNNKTGAITWGNGNGGTIGVINNQNSLLGKNINDNIGVDGLTILPNSYCIIKSPYYENYKGAITIFDGNQKTVGILDTNNSLVGKVNGDMVGRCDVRILKNNNVIVNNYYFDNNTAYNVGAITLIKENEKIKGNVNNLNSIIGEAIDDFSKLLIYELKNNQIILCLPYLNNGNIENAGAIKLINNLNLNGNINSGNALLGKHMNDILGYNGIIELSDSIIYIANPLVDNGIEKDVGAITRINVTKTLNGYIDSTNSLMGKFENDNIGNGGIFNLGNNNIVISSNQAALSISKYSLGAVTFLEGNLPLKGFLDTSNSIFGNNIGDQIGFDGITILKNKNYVIYSPYWDSLNRPDLGAITWASGQKRITGIVSEKNSMIGSNALSYDYIGSGGIYPLENGDYLICSPEWSNPDMSMGIKQQIGAVTICNGNQSSIGKITPSNSIIGNKNFDKIGENGITLLKDSKFLINSPNYDNEKTTDAGAITFIDANINNTEIISLQNSLFGEGNYARLGISNMLQNGDYFVSCPNCNNNKGATKVCDGKNGTFGIIDKKNAIVGNKPEDFVSDYGYSQINDSIIIIQNKFWDNKNEVNKGAICLLNINKQWYGEINSCNSLIDITEYRNQDIFNDSFNYLILGRPLKNKLSIFSPQNISLAYHLDSNIVQTYPNQYSEIFANNSCNIIASIESKNKFINSKQINSKVWIENIQNDSFVNRHYQLVSNIEDTIPMEVTLYFYQKEFDDFNNVNSKKLPKNPADNSGISNILIENRRGIILNSNGLPNSYSGAVKAINPKDSNIYWNKNLNRWEISFETKTLGGFFIKTKVNETDITKLLSSNYHVYTYPNPSNKDINIKNDNKLDITVSLFDIAGKLLIQKNILKNETIKIDISNLSSGIYIISTSLGESYKIIKNE